VLVPDGMAVSASRGSRALAVWTKAMPPAKRNFCAATCRVALCSLRSLAKSHENRGTLRYNPAVVNTLGFRSRGFATSPLEAYKSLVAEGKINIDPRQEAVMNKLTQLAKKVVLYTPPSGGGSQLMGSPRSAAAQSTGGFLSGIFGGGSAKPKAAPKPQVERLNIPAGTERGLYVYGGCGTGKTFMMDLFLDHVPIKKKRRVHFHEWMIEVHEKLHRLQKKNSLVREKANSVWTAEAAMAQRKALKKSGFDGSHGKTAGGGEKADDLVAQVAQEMMDEAWLLCFDEFQVTHISDAIIMKRLFSILFEKGAVIVATSNRPPCDLYLNGLNRSLFLPFIPMLEERCEVHDIDSAVDYRLLSLAEEGDDRRVYITPTAEDQTPADLLKVLERKFYRLCKNQVNVGTFVETQGRRVAVPKCGQSTNVAWFSFNDLCDKPLGAADYFAICSMFHTVFICNIPTLTLQDRDQVRRMITMIDSFYERHVKLVCTATKDPLTLFQVSAEESKNTAFDEIFAWDRTASRLIEMQSVEYLSEWLRDVDGEQFLAQLELTTLTDDDILDLWTRYDADDSGSIDLDECRIMLQDVMEVTQSHRHVSDDLISMMFEKMDSNHDELISREEFTSHLKEFGLIIKRSTSADGPNTLDP